MDSRTWARRAVRLAAVAGLLGLAGCSPSKIAGQGELPPDVTDPASLQTAKGAMAFYRGVLNLAPEIFDSVVAETAIIADELASTAAATGVYGASTDIDSRQNLEGGHYNSLNRVRAQAREARGFLASYAPDSSSALRGQMYAMEAYADVFLADQFCSGIPLSTVNFDGTYSLAAGSTTDQVYEHAVSLFDSALALAGDSTGFQQLARVGRARALLALGQYAAATAAAADVPDDYRFQMPLASTAARLLLDRTSRSSSKVGVPSVADREGLAGLDYRSSGDPRSASVLLGTDAFGNSVYFPAKYPQTGTVTLVLASGIEARLIEAEAALRADPADGRWLAILNQLRRTAWTTIVPALGEPLDDLSDPGTSESRVDLVFRERALWLYLTGHRFGDLRRLVRLYLRAPDAVFPHGSYPGGVGVYGTEVTVPVPESEREFNPKYAGCFNRDA